MKRVAPRATAADASHIPKYVSGADGRGLDPHAQLAATAIAPTVSRLLIGFVIGRRIHLNRADVPREERSGMAKLVFGMNQSLDGYVDHTAFAPGPTLFRHFIEEAQKQAGSVYGRQMYEIMRYWDDDQPEWSSEEHAFAAAWRKQPKWVVSRSLTSVGPNATLLGDDLEAAIRELKAKRDGEIEVAGPGLAHSLTQLGLIDEYRIYLHPVVLGHGKPYFAGPWPPLRLGTHERIGEDVIRLSYVPA